MAQDAVDRVLAARGHFAERKRRAEMAALGLAAVLHLGVVAVAFGLAHLKPKSEPLEFIAAQIVPAQALGVEKPRKRAEAPPAPHPEPPAAEPASEPEPEPPAPEPVVAPKPKPEPPPVPTGPLPRPKGWNDPPPAPATAKPTPTQPKPAAPTPAKPAAPAPAKPPAAAKPGPPGGTPGPGADVAKGNQAGPRGSSAGTAAGTSPFGDRIASIDPDFTYGYYIEQLLRQIDSKWTPPEAGRIRTIVRFRILRRGEIDQLDVAESSGINAFDLAALRAVKDASPFPPLPASYRNPTLNVTLIVR